jgi:hypothetical protein
VNASFIRRTAAAFALAALGPNLAAATVLWDGEASRGTGIFKRAAATCASPGSVNAVADAVHGHLWRYVKPAGLDRCLTHGARAEGGDLVFRSGSTYYLGWRSKLGSVADNDGIFQWGAPGTIAPVVLEIAGGSLHLVYNPPGGGPQILWSKPVSANAWNSLALAIRVSSSALAGSVELWWNGEAQLLVNGSTRYPARTFAADHVCPQWGIEGGPSAAVALTHSVDDLTIGTSLLDVNPGRAPAWQPGFYYATGAVVTHGGASYRCLQPHTSQVGWEPPNTPALWTKP